MWRGEVYYRQDRKDETSMGATALHMLPGVGEESEATALQHWRGSFVGLFFRI